MYGFIGKAQIFAGMLWLSGERVILRPDHLPPVKTLLCCVLFFITVIPVSAQRKAAARTEAPERPAVAVEDNGPKGWIGGAIGPSFPVGALASTDMTRADAGFASTFVHLNLNIGYEIAGPVSLYVIAHNTANRIDPDAFGKALSQSLPVGVTGKFEAQPWQMNGIVIGPYVKLLSSGSSSFFIRGMIGYASVRNPQLKVTLYKTGYQPVTATTESNSFFTFGYGLGAGANMRIIKYMQFMLGIDFLSATPTIRDLKTTYSNGAPYTVSDSYEQPYSVINVTAGLAYVIHK